MTSSISKLANFKNYTYLFNSFKLVTALLTFHFYKSLHVIMFSNFSCSWWVADLGLENESPHPQPFAFSISFLLVPKLEHNQGATQTRFSVYVGQSSCPTCFSCSNCGFTILHHPNCLQRPRVPDGFSLWEKPASGWLPTIYKKNSKFCNPISKTFHHLLQTCILNLCFPILYFIYYGSTLSQHTAAILNYSFHSSVSFLHYSFHL